MTHDARGITLEAVFKDVYVERRKNRFRCCKHLLFCLSLRLSSSFFLTGAACTLVDPGFIGAWRNIRCCKISFFFFFFACAAKQNFNLCLLLFRWLKSVLRLVVRTLRHRCKSSVFLCLVCAAKQSFSWFLLVFRRLKYPFDLRCEHRVSSCSDRLCTYTPISHWCTAQYRPAQ